MDEIEHRSAAARGGIVALNLLTPGLGLLRLGFLRAGLIFVTAPIFFLIISIGLFAVAPTATFVGAAAYVGVVIVLTLTLYIATFTLSWRRSKIKTDAYPWWSRWYGLVLVGVLISGATNLVTPLCHRFYKPFYLPAESMAPTLNEGDKITADMRGGRHPAMGDIVLFDNSRTYIKRVAALPGDRIAMKAGVPIINGVSAIQHDKGLITFRGYDGSIPAHLISEKLPGEVESHLILDTGPSVIDDMPEQLVPPSHIFVLGDNRDRSADSRVSVNGGGSGMVALNNIVGRPLFIHWSTDRSRIGQVVH
jgi:signal peptidase I